MAREVLGMMACPECGGAAEVKKTRAGLAYRWCMDCNAQYFPRSPEASDRLLEKCRAGTVREAEPERKQEPETHRKQEQQPKEKAKQAKMPGPFDFLNRAEA